MAENNVNIQMRLSSVREVSFMMSPANVGDNINPEDIQMGFSSQIQPDVKTDSFTLNFGVRYELADEVVLESVYCFVFEVLNLKQFVVFNADNNITVTHLMPHFLSVALGTMRGILVVKTAGTVLAKYPLPMIDVNVLNSNLSVQE